METSLPVNVKSVSHEIKTEEHTGGGGRTRWCNITAVVTVLRETQE